MNTAGNLIAAGSNPATEEARNAAIRRVVAANEEWLGDALDALDAVARRQSIFTTDDVWREIDARKLPEPTDRRAMTGVVARAMKLRLCERATAFSNSNRRACHAGPKRVYHSLVFGEDGRMVGVAR